MHAPHSQLLTELYARLWESLGFTKAGRIPRAGRLKKTDGTGEEFIDAWVFYHRFGDRDRIPEM